MTHAPDPTEPEFLVFHADGTTRVSRRGVDKPVFSGPASSAIQYAIDAGAESGTGIAIAIAPGTYELEESVTLAGSTWLAGSGTATTLRAESGLDADLLTVPEGTEHARVSDLRIHGNRSANERGACLAVHGYTWRIVFDHLVVRNGADDGVRFDGEQGDGYSYEPTLTDIDVARCGGDGFVFGFTGDLFGTNLYAEACERYGFTMADAGGTLVHPHAYDTHGEAGIRFLESAQDTTLLGAHSERNRRHGVLVKGERITLRNGFFANNSRDSPDSYSGVVFDGATRCTLSESTLVNDPDRPETQRHGLVETVASRENRIAGNLFQHNLGSAVERGSRSAGSSYRDNRGYRTENGGRATVGDGEIIQHGLAERPEQYWVESTAPGTYAHVVAVDQARLVVEVIQVQTGERVASGVDVTWGVSA
jgi:hypothetical protein